MKEFQSSYDNPLLAQFYDFIVKRLGRGDLESEGVKFCARQFGEPILELGCGTGLTLLPLAEMGYSITGLEKSPEILEILKQKLGLAEPSLKDRVELVLGDMTTLPIDLGSFRLIIFAGSQFLHIKTDEQRLRCLKGSRHLLTDDGVIYIVNSKLEAKEEHEWVKHPEQPGDEWTLKSRRKCIDGAYTEEFRLISKLQNQQESFPGWELHSIDDQHMRDLISQAGLRTIPLPQNLPLRENTNTYLCKKC